MAYADDHYREMAKWAHHRLATARRRAEEEQHLGRFDESPCSASRNGQTWIATWIATALSSGVSTVVRCVLQICLTARIGHRRTRTDRLDDTGGQVVAGSNPVSPTQSADAGQRSFTAV
jgi:hypothetical protein